VAECTDSIRFFCAR